MVLNVVIGLGDKSHGGRRRWYIETGSWRKLEKHPSCEASPLSWSREQYNFCYQTPIHGMLLHLYNIFPNLSHCLQYLIMTSLLAISIIVSLLCSHRLLVLKWSSGFLTVNIDIFIFRIPRPQRLMKLPTPVVIRDNFITLYKTVRFSTCSPCL